MYSLASRANWTIRLTGDGYPAAQIGGDESGRRVLPVVQRPLRHLGDEPLPGLPGGRVQAGGGGVLGVGAHTHDIREIQRVVVAPLLGGAEVAAVARFERSDAVGQQSLELDSA